MQRRTRTTVEARDLMPYVWSYGMGTESTAGILRMLTDPTARPDTIAPDFSNLVVVTGIIFSSLLNWAFDQGVCVRDMSLTVKQGRHRPDSRSPINPYSAPRHHQVRSQEPSSTSVPVVLRWGLPAGCEAASAGSAVLEDVHGVLPGPFQFGDLGGDPVYHGFQAPSFALAGCSTRVVSVERVNDLVQGKTHVL
jgi:hypothetical protein